MIGHVGPAVTPGHVWTAWSFDPLVLVGLGLAAVLYRYGLAALWGRERGRVVSSARAAAFYAGLAVILVALVSPLDALASRLLFAHMVQHLLLMTVAAPLLVVGSPMLPITLGLPRTWRRALWRVGRWPALRAVGRGLTTPVVSWFAGFVVLWVWHLPTLYEAAVHHAPLHALEHAMFLGASAMFWWVALQPGPRRRLARGWDVGYVIAASFQGSALGALLTFASVPLYPLYEKTAPPWGFTGLGDQQLAGLIMWIPFGVVYMVVAAALFVSWLRHMDLDLRRTESGQDGVAPGPVAPTAPAPAAAGMAGGPS